MRGGGDRKDRDTKVLKLRIFGEKISDEKRPEAGPRNRNPHKPPGHPGLVVQILQSILIAFHFHHENYGE